MKRKIETLTEERDELQKKLGHTKSAKTCRDDTPHRQAREFLANTNLPVDEPAVHAMAPIMATVNVVKNAPSGVKRSLFKDAPEREGIKCSLAKSISMAPETMYGKTKKGRETNNRENISNERRNAVQDFLRRQDNSQELPDQKNQGKYALTDTLINLHQKFRSENPHEKMHYSWFCGVRDPKQFKDVSYLSRNVCLCITHANIHLAIDICPTLPKSSEALSQLSDDEISSKVENWKVNQVKIDQWESVDIVMDKKGIDGEEKKVKRKEIIHHTMSKADYLKFLLGLMPEFRQHQYRVTEIFRQLRFLKKKMGPNAVVVYLDYAENWPVRYMDEIQENHYNNKLVTVLPMVVYYNSGDTIKHKSFCMLSDDTNHSVATTVVGITRLVPYLHQLVESLKMIHFVSDSPVSQFRNQFMAHFVAHFGRVFPDAQCTWTWMEAGHGKSACDGVGGGVKKVGNNMVKTKIIIRNAEEFNEAMQTRFGLKTKLIHASKADITPIRERDVPKWPCSKVEHIRQVHAMIGRGKDSLFAEVPCYNECCLSQDGEVKATCPVWQLKWEAAVINEKISVSKVPHTPSVRDKVHEAEIEQELPKINEHVVLEDKEGCHQIAKVVKFIDEFIQVQMYVYEGDKRRHLFKLTDEMVLVVIADVVSLLEEPRAVRGKKNVFKFDV